MNALPKLTGSPSNDDKTQQSGGMNSGADAPNAIDGMPRGEQTPPALHVAASDSNDNITLKQVKFRIGTLRTIIYAVRVSDNRAMMREIQKICLRDADWQIVEQMLSEDIDTEKIAVCITCPDEALELYTLSSFIVRNAPMADRSYFDLLAKSLRLPDSLKKEVERRCALRRKSDFGFN